MNYVIKLTSKNLEVEMGKKLKKNEKKKTKILKAIDRLKNKITAKEKNCQKLILKLLV